MASASNLGITWTPAGRMVLYCALLAINLGCRGVPYQTQSLVAFCDRDCEEHLRAAAELESRHGGISHDAGARARLARIGRDLLRANPRFRVSIRFEVLNCPKVNAFSLPGGNVYLTRGLYEQLADDSLVAAAIAHELAHVAAGDGIFPCPTDTSRLNREIAADRRAATYLAAAGFSPAALLELLAIVKGRQKPEWAQARIQRLRATLASRYEGRSASSEALRPSSG